MKVPYNRSWTEPRSGLSLAQTFSTKPSNDGVLCIKYSKDNKYLASGLTNGDISICDTISGKLLSTLNASYSLRPITCLK